MSSYTVEVKLQKDLKLGLKIDEQNGRIHVADISEGTAIATTDLQVGDAIISVDGTDILGYTKESFVSLLQSITRNFSLEAAPVSSIKIHKPTPKTKFGFKFVTKEGFPEISEIFEDGLLGSSDLQVGHKILAVNGICMKDTRLLSTLSASGSDITFDVILPTFKAHFGPTFKMNCSLHTVPFLLEGAGVSPRKWQKIYHDIVNKILPLSISIVKNHESFQNSTKNYVSKTAFLSVIISPTFVV